MSHNHIWHSKIHHCVPGQILIHGIFFNMGGVYRRCVSNLGEVCRKYLLRKINTGHKALCYLIEKEFSQVI